MAATAADSAIATIVSSVTAAVAVFRFRSQHLEMLLHHLLLLLLKQVVLELHWSALFRNRVGKVSASYPKSRALDARRRTRRVFQDRASAGQAVEVRRQHARRRLVTSFLQFRSGRRLPQLLLEIQMEHLLLLLLL